MNRRAFLARLGFGTVAAAAAATGLIDVERLLWTPDAKTIFIPEPVRELLRRGDIFTIEGRFAINPLTRQAMPFLQRFIVTDDASSADPIVRLSPAIITAGPYRTTTRKHRPDPHTFNRDVERVTPVLWSDLKLA